MADLFEGKYRAWVQNKWRYFHSGQIKKVVKRGKWKGYAVVEFLDGKFKVKIDEAVSTNY